MDLELIQGFRVALIIMVAVVFMILIARDKNNV